MSAFPKDLCACGGPKDCRSARCNVCYRGPDREPERFMAKVAVVPGDCWTWTGAVGPLGYGIFCKTRAHRAAWRLFVGPIPPGAHVLHHCDNRLCVYHGHLFLGTHADNMADMAAKGRGRSGKTRLSDIEVATIRARHAEGETPAALGRAFGVHPRYVGKLVAMERRARAA